MQNPSQLRRQAEQRLRNTAIDPKKLVLFHAVIALGSTLLITALNFFFGQLIDNTGGLSGLGLRSVLSTVRSILELVSSIALPFWEIGLLFAAMNWARGVSASYGDLLQGFRRFGSVLALHLLRSWLFITVGMAIFYLSTAVYMMTPLATPLLELLEPVLEQASSLQQPESLLTPELMASAAQVSKPLVFIFRGLFCAVAIPLFYRLRFADFAVISGTGAIKAMVNSVHITRKKNLQVFRLDLSFWWFYLLQLLCLGISYTDMLLPALGVALPLSKNAAFFLFYVLGAACQCLLLWQYQARIKTTYCLMYESLSQTPAPRVPWN